MRVVTKGIEGLKGAPYNPRVRLVPGSAGFEKLRRSLEEFELVQPIVWNERTGHVVGGHQRVEVLRHLGRTEVECVVVDLPLEREQALNVALNNAAVGSEWDAGKLVELVEELQGLPDFDATLTGFDPQQLADLVLTPAVAPAAGWERADGEFDLKSDDVRVTLEVPADCWEEVQPTLDDLVAREPEVRLHVRFPRGHGGGW